MHTPVLLAFVLALPAEMAADVAAPMPAFVECPFDDSPDLEAVARVFEAPPGGRWWLPRFEDGQLLVSGQGTFTVVDGGGVSHPIEDPLYLTPAAASFAVPDGLPSGTVLQLRENGVAVRGVLLRVSDAAGASAPLEITRALVNGVAPRGCSTSCAFDGMAVPAARLLTLEGSGGPAILDAWLLFDGAVDVPREPSPRVVDSQLVGSADEAVFSIDRRLGQLSFVTSANVIVRLSDPHTLEVLHEQLLFSEALELPVTDLPEPPPPCGQGQPMTPDMTWACANVNASPSAAFALLVLGLCARAFRRRRDAAGARGERPTTSL